MNTEDIRSLFFFTIFWVQPIWWMLFFHNRTKRLDSLSSILMVAITGLFIFLYYVPSGQQLLEQFASSRLIFVYLTIGLLMSNVLERRGWHFPQAISISALVVFIGSFYWESPFLIKNALTTGFQSDWLLHITGLFMVWFIKDSIGWKTDKFSLGLVIVGFISATVFMLFWPVPLGVVGSDIWNSTYFMIDRMICTVITFLVIKKDIPFEVKT